VGADVTEIAKALYAFYSGFGIPAYTEDNVPSDAQLPYITYTLPQSEVFSGATHQVRVWYYGESNAPVNAKVDEIIAAIGQGVKLKAKNGFIIIYPGTGTLAQNQPSDDETRIVYLNLEIHCYVWTRGEKK
jgi:hypothetical protein